MKCMWGMHARTDCTVCAMHHDDVHHLVGNQMQCLLCAVKSVLDIHHAETDYSSPQVICITSARAKAGCRFTVIYMASQQT